MLKYTVGLRNLDGIPTTTLAVTVNGTKPTPGTATAARRAALVKFRERGYRVFDEKDVGIVKIREV